MQICEVLGHVVASHKVRPYGGWKLLTVQPLDLDGSPMGPAHLAVDTVDAGEGDRVLVLTEGGSANIVLAMNRAPVASVIVGVVDQVELFPDIEEGDAP